MFFIDINKMQKIIYQSLKQQKMQIHIKQEIQHSTKSKDNPSKQFQTGIDSDDQKNIQHIFSETHYLNSRQSQIPISQHDQLKQINKQNRAQTSNAVQSNRATNSPVANKKQYIQSIRLSYLVLSPTQSSPQKKKKKLIKKSFGVICQQEEPEAGEQKIKQTLKTPLIIDLKKLEQKNKYADLCQNLQLYNGKYWDKCHFDIDTRVQQLIVSNLHIPFSTISKIKIFKPDIERQMKQVKVTYEKVNEQGSLFLNVKEDKSINKVPKNYLMLQQIITYKLTFQNRFKQTKWQKKQHICEQLIFGSYIFGQIYKKSQFFGKWEKRYIVLNGQGIFSYKSSGKKQDCSFSIQRQSIEYLWTRFDLIDNYLIIKIKHGLKQTQFGIPITNYASPHYKNWLYYFYRLMAPN